MSLQHINATMENFRYSTGTVVRAVHLADTYLQRVFTSTAHAPASATATTAEHTTRPLLAAPQWQLLTVACLSLAAVIEEEYDDPPVADLTPIVEPDQYTAASVREAKRSVAVTLEYQLSRPIAMDALYELLRTPGLDAYLDTFLRPLDLSDPTPNPAAGWQDEQQRSITKARWLGPFVAIAEQYLLAGVIDPDLFVAHPIALAVAAINAALHVVAHLYHSEFVVVPTPAGGIVRYHRLLQELAIDVPLLTTAVNVYTADNCMAKMVELLPISRFLTAHTKHDTRASVASPPSSS